MGRATWSKADALWLEFNAHGLPPDPHYVHAHQRWSSTRRVTDRQQPPEYDAPWFKAWCAEMTRTERAVAWLWFVFGGRNAAPRG